MKNSAMKLTLCRADLCKNNQPYPYVLLKGIWLREWGFNPGDQITITSPENKMLVIKVSKVAADVNLERRLKFAQKELMSLSHPGQ
jgi:hypothetical protein